MPPLLFTRNLIKPSPQTYTFLHRSIRSKHTICPNLHSITHSNSHPYPSTLNLTIPSNMSTYRAAIPSPSSSPPTVPSSILSFYESFYATSDDPSPAAHARYVDAFTPSATLIMGTRVATGSEEITALRKGLWSGPVQTRLHTVEKIFSFDRDGREVMLYGSVRYGLKNGREVVVDWAGRAEVVVEGGEVRMGFYQVYLDSAPVANAMKD